MIKKIIVIESEITIGENNDVWSTKIKRKLIKDDETLNQDDKETLWEDANIDINKLRKELEKFSEGRDEV